MKISKYDMEQVEKDFQYYKDRWGDSNSSTYYLLKSRYRARLEYASQRLNEELKKEEGQ